MKVLKISAQLPAKKLDRKATYSLHTSTRGKVQHSKLELADDDVDVVVDETQTIAFF